MSTVILKAPVGAGKTEAALDELTRVVSDPVQPFASAWVLLATQRQEVAFRQRLIERRQDRQMYFGVEFFTFTTLNQRLLNMAGALPQRIDETVRRALIRKILTDLRQEKRLEIFSRIALMPGFIRVIADFIYELKQNLVYPDAFAQAARNQKDRELVLIYERYQGMMQQYALVDREGEAWLALEAAAQNPQLAQAVSLLLVDGYDQFTGVQAALLARLSQQVGQVSITLTALPDQAETMGLRFERALTDLREAHAAIGATFTELTLPLVSTERKADLQHLGQSIFQINITPLSAAGDVQLLEAADPAQETASLLRQVKHLLLNGYRPDDILIAVRNWDMYQSHFQTLGRLYDLPLLLHQSASLSRNPAVAVLMDVLSLSLNQYPRRALLDVLKSVYVDIPGFNREAIAALDRISLVYRVLDGDFDVWRAAIDAASQENLDEEGESKQLISHELGDELSLSLQDFFEKVHVDPDEEQTIAEHVAWVESLIGIDPQADPDTFDDSEESIDETLTLNMIRCIREAGSPSEDIVNRDILAISTFKRILRGLLMTQDLLFSLFGQESRLSWRDFYEALLRGVTEMPDSPHNIARSGRVLVTTATDARGLPHRCVMIPGLAEGVFPAQVGEDPLYLDNERLLLKQRGVQLATQSERADDEGLFYELIRLPGERLILSRPTVKDGKPWVESHLWRAVKSCFVNLPIMRLAAGEVPTADQALTPSEITVALVESFSAQSNSQPEIASIQRWLEETHSAYWQHIQSGRDIENNRLSNQPFDRYSGRIEQPGLRAHIKDYLGDRYAWSASRFNEYGACPFRFFAGRLLRLESMEEPEEGLDVLQLGTLYHAILERTYAEIANEGLSITPENLGDALEILEEKAAEIMADAPANLGFRQTALWQQEQQVMLKRLKVVVSTDFSSESDLEVFGSPRQPLIQEAPFGLKDQPFLRLNLGDGVQAVKVRGLIDRIDQVGTDGVLVLDYKSGATKINHTEIEKGRNFQMLIYLEAVKQLYPERTIEGGLFWHIRNQTFSGMPKGENRLQLIEEVIEKGRVHIANYVRRARAGVFSVQPTEPKEGKCVSYCEFSQLCRLAMTNQYKKA